METFSACLDIYEGNPPLAIGFNSQKPVMLSFDTLFVVILNKLFNSHSTSRKFET